MSEEEIIKVQYEAMKKISQGNRKFVMRIIHELGAHMRTYIVSRQPDKVTCDELCEMLENATKNWNMESHSLNSQVL